MSTSPHNENSKFDSSGKKPLHHRDDEGFIRKLIWEIIGRKHYVRRESKYHIKVREVNYWPSTGTITIDGEGRHPEKGEQALLALLEKRYPKRRDTNKETQATSLEFSSPPAAPIFNIDLDDLDLSVDYDPVPSDSWEDAP